MHDSFAYYKLRQRVITILDNCYYNLRQVLQFMTIHWVILYFQRWSHTNSGIAMIEQV